MATREELYQALRNADAAGDAEGAKKLAAYIQSLPTDTPAQAEQPKADTGSLVDQAARVVKMANPVTAALSLLTDKNARQDAGNMAAGMVRGAGSIGSTILAPIDKATDLIKGDRGPTLSGLISGNQPISRNDERRQAIDEGLRSLGADPESGMYKAGKLSAEVAGTSGMGGVLANGLRTVAPGAVGLANALRTGGMVAGNAPGSVNLLTRVIGGAVTGGASAGLVNPEDAKAGAMIGGALPVATTVAGTLTRGVGRMLRGGDVSPEVKALAQRAQELGIDIPADRLVNSKPMNALAASLDYVPFSGRAATEARMNSQLNQALSRTFGQDTSNVTQALRKADDALGGQFDSFLQQNTVKVDNQFLNDLADAANQASKELGSDGASIIGKQVDEIMSKAANGEIDGQAAYNIKRTLDRIGKRNSPEAWYALDLKQKLMEALNRSVGPDKASAFANLRQQYGNMLSLQKLAKNGAEGEISVARLANMGNIRNPQMQELADIAAQFVKPREGMHGAAQRAVAGMAAGSLGGLPAVAGMAAGGRATNMLLNSQMARNAVMGEGSPAVENMLAKILPLTYRTAPVLSGQ